MITNTKQDEQIIELLKQQKLTLQEIGEKFDLTRQRIYQISKKYEIPAVVGRRPKEGYPHPYTYKCKGCHELITVSKLRPSQIFPSFHSADCRIYFYNEMDRKICIRCKSTENLKQHGWRTRKYKKLPRYFCTSCYAGVKQKSREWYSAYRGSQKHREYLERRKQRLQHKKPILI